MHGLKVRSSRLMGSSQVRSSHLLSRLHQGACVYCVWQIFERIHEVIGLNNACR